MRYGVTIFATDVSIDIVELAKAVEDRGLESMWVPEHTHIPTSRRSPYPGGGELPEQYKRCLDPFVALTAAAIAAPTLRVGTGILLAAQHEPIVTAKAVASIDHVTGGRFTLGIGFGWNDDEMTDHGVEYGTRRGHAREHVLAMRRLWEDDIAEHHGEHVEVPPSWSWPKPAQRPLPVLLGGAAGPKLFEHIAEYGQGWIPIGGKGITDAVPRLRDQLAAAGRDPATLEIVPFGSTPDHGKLDHFEKVGVTECVFDLPSAPAEQVLPILDRYAGLVAERR
ncbi:MAG: LLM class F420-dependent oxidoreductase [Acidimicrobiales bacterium]